MKKFLRGTIPLLIPILLLALFSRVPLAQPEQTVPEEARLVGYYLLPDELVPPNWESAENGWEEYSSRIAYINGLERILLPQTVLKAQKDEDGQYRFPGPEGRRFFLVQEQNMVDGNPEATVELHSDLSQDRYGEGQGRQKQSHDLLTCLTGSVGNSTNLLQHKGNPCGQYGSIQQQSLEHRSPQAIIPTGNDSVIHRQYQSQEDHIRSCGHPQRFHGDIRSLLPGQAASHQGNEQCHQDSSYIIPQIAGTHKIPQNPQHNPAEQQNTGHYVSHPEAHQGRNHLFFHSSLASSTGG